MLLFTNMIWIFGDSFSHRFIDFIEPSNVRDYVKLKGYSPKMYFDYLSEEYGEEINNHSLGGMCNDYIFLKFIENYQNIKKNDIVLFGWTEITRFSVPHNDIWYSSIFFNNVLSKTTINEIEVTRTHPLHKERQISIMNFIDSILNKNMVVHWTWSNIDKNERSTIEKETNGQIIDFHYGEMGQFELYETISQELKKSNKIRIDTWE